MKPHILQITEEFLNFSRDLTEDDLGSWAVYHDGKLTLATDEEDAQDILEDVKSQTDGIESEISFAHDPQCDDGDDFEDDQGGVWGDALFDSISERAWLGEEV